MFALLARTQVPIAFETLRGLAGGVGYACAGGMSLKMLCYHALAVPFLLTILFRFVLLCVFLGPTSGQLFFDMYSE